MLAVQGGWTMSLDLYLHDGWCGACERYGDQIWWRNITHNLVKMAIAANVYEVCWRSFGPPGDKPIVTAAQALPIVSAGIQWLDENEAIALQLEPPNGWGSYQGLRDFLREFERACIDAPTAVLRSCG